MSHVFLAEESRLGRQVVIKVLPPEMGAGVNAERFEREIQLAAKLQHPHIVPLLTAGASGDLLYYVMPFIQGESLRVKLAREGELPVTEATRILRDVVDALAYAHRNGVVHRDIKPDNVLLSEGHAVVTDFGVAKAVSASSGNAGGSLTSLGVALGTPAYMAPEQAAADPHVDHRADIYAVGALAYEMLCGRPPFTAPTPQALLAAHITQTPDPITRYRPTVSAQLNGLVMKCLEKRAADRWQSAAELVPQLDAMTTPSGGLAPTGAQTIISSGTEAAIRRAHPGRVALLFGTAAVLVLAVVWVLERKLGLPDWVFYGAVGLLAIGLPIMLVTGHHERQRAIARTTAVYTPPAEGAARWFTWRKAIVGGGLAFLGLALLAAAYSAMRVLGIGPVGTLVASGVLKNREQLLLADFENRTADTTLGPSLTEAMRVDLSQSPTLRLVDQQLVREALTRMERQSAGTLSPSLAREVAERQGIKAVVTGQIDPVGTGYVLSANLVSASDGQVLTAVRETAADPGALLGAIDRLSSKLRERIGESLVTIREKPPLEQVTTASLPALRKYTEALRLEEQDRIDEAIPMIREAVALDTGFAMAWRKLAVFLGNTGQSYAEETAAATRAYAMRDRLPELERSLAAGFYFTFVEYDPAKVAASYRAALAIDPDNLISLNNLSGALVRQRRWPEAESLAVHATRIGRGSAFFRNAVVAQVSQGRMAEAQATVERAKQRLPGNAGIGTLAAEFTAAQGDIVGADSQMVALRRQFQTSQLFQSYADIALATIRGTRGKLADSEHYLNEVIASGEARRSVQDVFNATAGLVEINLRYRNRTADALAALSANLAKHPLDSMTPLDRPYTDLARLYSLAGKPEQAKRYLKEYESAVPATLRAGDFNVDLATGYVAEAEGRHNEAMAAYRKFSDESGGCNICGLYEIATVYDRLGQADSALAIYERFVTTPSLSRLYSNGFAFAPSYKRLGELYEAKGDRKRAAGYYERFVELWKDADAELQPGVKEVRGRLAKLAQEPGT